MSLFNEILPVSSMLFYEKQGNTPFFHQQEMQILSQHFAVLANALKYHCHSSLLLDFMQVLLLNKLIKSTGTIILIFW